MQLLYALVKNTYQIACNVRPVRDAAVWTRSNILAYPCKTQQMIQPTVLLGIV